MSLSGRAVTTLAIAYEQALMRMGVNPARDIVDRNFFYDLLVDGVLDVASQLSVPMAVEVLSVGLIAGDPEIDLSVGDSKRVVLAIHDVTLYDLANDEERSLPRVSIHEIQRISDQNWREVDGEPTHWLRGGGTGFGWNRSIRLYPRPDSTSASQWPQVRVYASVADFDSDDGTLVDFNDEGSIPLLKAAMFHAMSEWQASRSSFDQAQFWAAKLSAEVLKLRLRASRDVQQRIVIPPPPSGGF